MNKYYVCLISLIDNETVSHFNHKNEVRTDNRVENLEWMTSKENMNYGSRNLNISKSLKGNKNCLGRKLSKETKLKLSIITKRRYAGKVLGVDLVKVV